MHKVKKSMCGKISEKRKLLWKLIFRIGGIIIKIGVHDKLI